jgi:hypothetical protein
MSVSPASFHLRARLDLSDDARRSAPVRRGYYKPRLLLGTFRGRETVPDAIGVAKVHLVGRLSVKSMMGHLGVVLFDVEIDQLFELREAFERMQVQPLMA